MRAQLNNKNASAHSLFFGKAVVVVRREGPGGITLTADSEGLEPANWHSNPR